MKGLTFKKGIHPHYHKESTQDKPITILAPKGEMVYPMSQHIGAPCTPLVKKGDHVYVGQKIGEVTGFVAAPIHASVSGTVKAVEERLTFRGIKDKCIVIENDFLYEEIQELQAYRMPDIKSLGRKELVDIVKEAGLVGMGGAAFPTHVKLNIPEDKEVEFIIINGAECEPYLTSDHRVMLEEGERIIAGLEILLQVFPKAKALIGIEDNKMDAIENLTHLAKEMTRIEVCTLHTKYPQGSEKHLIYATTGREVPSGKLPIEVGCIVQNIDSIVAIWRAVTKGRPIMRRIITVAGSGVKNPCNLKVRTGTSYREILDYAQWDEERTVKIIAGGPMMGVAISDVDVPVVKGTSAILCFTEEEVKGEKTSHCIRCSKCVQVCPMGLIPNVLHRSAIHDKLENFTAHHGMDCIECGCCSFICPAKCELVQSIRTAKAQLRAKK
ncbi:electron transport complex subunit RsxC [Sporanaerobium hydrogeniformans]|uniref:Electron transport complex subunit RsxC n=1 Tax=Sporanaerobium hydrogeniformans TaxID=3072179 RepID=A0AC61DF62_9FIRM|nr:electron transport complex subunit RsxC [Sporanaerobium hydrogeniformans]PHV71473.1 electron transport complex subunit RsxC [Sporanaerobium hydrogeniformans]